ncbi:MAG: SUMF1/EgtB/PvdO family nonheme iron enzyme [Bacteroidales bacterium]|nr:SUMF1/EgtB/PvdO family nonheme iron enzyme [Bacteroidales bacterium]
MRHPKPTFRSAAIALLWAASLAGCLCACCKDEEDATAAPAAAAAETTVTVPDSQLIGHEADYASRPLTGGIRLRFQMEGVTLVEVESVDGYAIAGTATVATVGNQPQIKEITDKRSIINFAAPEGATFASGTDYYVTAFPCDVYGGYRLSIYKDGLVAHYFGVHQTIGSDAFISPTDLVEEDLEFVDPAAPLVEEERPGLDATTRDMLARYRANPTAENRQALLEQMGVKYDKVVARKKAKLRQLEREAHDQYLIDEMQAIVDEMVDNRDIRLEQQFLRLIDPREDEDSTDAWVVLRGVPEHNAYIGYAPVTNAEYAAYDASHTYAAGQERYPAVGMTYAEAAAYCQWLGSQDASHTYRLPTEDEWIYAAGHMPKDIVMNSNHVERGLTAVDAYEQSKGACGGIDFWGNCWEWTSTQNATGQYIVKGGSWDSSRDACRTEYSDDARDGTQGYANVGIRVVREDR